MRTQMWVFCLDKLCKILKISCIFLRQCRTFISVDVFICLHTGLEVHSSEFLDDDCLEDEIVGVKNDILVPKVGMKIANEKEVFEFYKNYASW